MDYPYVILPGDTLHVPKPHIPAVFSKNGRSTSSILTLVDSGADFSFAPFAVALHLGIKVDKANPRKIHSFSGDSLLCYPIDIDVTVAEKTVRMPVYFGGSLTSLFPCILGQDVFFTLTKITFRRSTYTVSIEWENSIK